MIPSNPSPDEVLLADDGYMWHGKKSEMLKWCNNGRYLSCCYHIYKASLGYVTVDCDFYVEGTTCSYPEDLGWFCCKERSLNGRPHGPIIPDVGTCKEKARKRDPVVAPPRPTDLPERPEQKKDSPATCPQRQNNLPWVFIFLQETHGRTFDILVESLRLDRGTEAVLYLKIVVISENIPLCKISNGGDAHLSFSWFLKSHQSCHSVKMEQTRSPWKVVHYNETFYTVYFSI